MSTFNAGAIEASLTLDRSSWNTELKELQAQFTELENKSISIMIDADTDNFMVAKDNVELFADDLDEKSITITADMDAEKFFQAAAQVELMIEQLSDMKIDVAATMDSTDFHAAAAQVELTADALDAMNIEVTADMDSTKFHAAAAQVELVGDVLAQRSINIGVETTGVPKTLAEFAELEVAAEIVDGRTIHMNVDYDENSLKRLVGGGGGSLAGGGGGYMGFWQILIYGVLALMPILSVATGATAAAIVGFSAAIVGALGPLALMIGAIVLLIKDFKKTDPKDYTPGMRELADALKDIKKVVDGLINSKVADTFFHGMAIGVEAGVDVLKLLKPLLDDVAGLFVDVATNVSKFVNSDEFAGWLDFFGGDGLIFLEDFLSIGGNLLRFLMNLFIAIAPFAKRMMKGLTDDLSDLAGWSQNLGENKGFQEWISNAEEFGPRLLRMLGAIVEAFMHISDAIRPFAGPMIDFFTNLAGAITKIPTPLLTQLILAGVGLIGFFKIVVPLASGLISVLEGLAGGIELVTAALGISLGPLLLIIGAIAALAFVVYYLWQNNEDFRKSIIDAWNDIRDTVTPIIDDIVKMFKEEWPEIKKTAQDVWQSVQEIVRNAVGIIQQLIFFVTVAITFIWKHFGDQLISIMRTNLRGLLQIIRGAFQFIAGLFAFFNDLLHGRWSKLWGDIKEMAKGAWSIIQGIFRIALGILTGIMGLIKIALVGAWHALWDLIKSAARAGWGQVQDIFNNFIGWLRGIPGHINDALSGSFSGLLGDFRDVLNTIIGWWNSLHFHIPGFNPPGPGSFGGMDVGVTQLPHFASGGVVDEKTLAVVGEGNEPEIISPESKMIDIVRKYGGGGMDYSKMTDALMRALAPIMGSVLTPELLNQILEKAGATVQVDASNDDRSARAIAAAMSWELRLLGYGGEAVG